MSDTRKTAHTPGLAFYRAGQDPGDPAREPIHLEFRKTDAGENVYTGWAADVHPQFVELFKAAPAMEEALREAEDLLAQFIGYSEALRKIGRGFSGTSVYGTYPETVLSQLRSLLARLDAAKGE